LTIAGSDYDRGIRGKEVVILPRRGGVGNPGVIAMCDEGGEVFEVLKVERDRWVRPKRKGDEKEVKGM
jgi:hypothetical protein